MRGEADVEDNTDNVELLGDTKRVTESGPPLPRHMPPTRAMMSPRSVSSDTLPPPPVRAGTQVVDHRAFEGDA